MARSGLFHELRRRHVFRVAAAYVVVSWLLLQLGAIVFPTLHAPSWCESVLLAFLVLGFPVALLLAWAFEATPEGVRRTVPADAEAARPEVAGRRLGRKIDFVIITVLVVAVGVLLWRQFGLHPKSAPAQTPTQSATTAGSVPVTTTTTAAAPTAATVIPAKSIAVLPFENLSTDKANGYFADGMQDVILSKLAEIGGLTVISRTSTMRYQSHPEDLKAIGRQLGVANLLEGSVQKAGDQVLINVQLINALTDHHLWAHSYQRTLENIFGVEGEVAEKVAAALKAKLDPAERARVTSVPTRNPAAYDAYLRGLVQETSTSGQSPAALRSAATAYRRAVALDPQFALAWAHLCSVDSLMHFLYPDYAPAGLAKAKRALARALALAPEAAATQLALGDYNYHGLRRYGVALTAYRKVLAKAPNNAHALSYIGYVERREGHWQASVDDQQRALRLDPRNVQQLEDLGETYMNLLHFARAEELLKRALVIAPADPFVTAILAHAYQSEGKLAQAARVLATTKLPPTDWRSFPTAVRQALLTRRYDDAVGLLHAALATKHLSAYATGLYYEMLGFAEQLSGERDAARHAYRQAVAVLQHIPATGALAMAQAGLGKKATALASARRVIARLPTSRDAYSGPVGEVVLAVVQARLGEKEQAIAMLQRLRAVPPGSAVSTYLTPALLRLDPSWDPLRTDPRFQALLKEQPIRTPSSTSAN